MLSSSSRSILYFARSYHLVSSRAASTVEMLNPDNMSQLGKLSILKSDRVHSPRNSVLSSSHRELARLSPVRHVSASILGIHSHHSDAASSIQLPHWNQRMDGGSVFYSTSSGAEKPPFPQDEAVNSPSVPKIASELEALKEEIRKNQAAIDKVESEIASNKEELQGVNAQLADQDPSSKNMAYLLNQQTFLQGEIQALRQQESDLRQQASNLRQQAFDLRQQAETLRQEMARLLPVTPEFTLKDLHQQMVAGGSIRAARFDKPLLLVNSEPECSLSFMDREPAVKMLVSEITKRVKAYQEGQMTLTKELSPILAVYGGPGSGKSRFLDEVASPAKRLKFLTRFEKELSLPVFQALKDAVGISVTFNSGMPHVASPCDKDPISGLALRLFYSYYIDPKSMSWRKFCERVRGNLDLDELLDSILSDLDSDPKTKSRHVIICVDETLLGVTYKVSKEELDFHLAAFLGTIGSNLERIPRIHFVLSSLSFQLLLNQQTLTGRSIYLLPLHALSEQSVDTIYSHCWETAVDDITKQTNRQFMLDAAGSPRLLWNSSRLLEIHYKSLEFLRASLSNQDVLRKLQACVSSPHLRNAFLLALTKKMDDKSCDPCLVLGLLVMQQARPQYPLPDPMSLYPVIAPSLFYCLRIAHKEQPKTLTVDPLPLTFQLSVVDPIADKLIILIQKFFAFDLPSSIYHGIIFEHQFNIFLQIRCLAMCSPLQVEPSTEQHIASVVTLLMTLTKSLSLLSLLNVEDRIHSKNDMPDSPLTILYGNLFRNEYVIPADLKLVTSAAFSFEPGTLWIPSDATYEGIDALLSLKNQLGQDFVFGFQYKWSKLREKHDESTNTEFTKSASPLSCDTVATAIFNTCKHHQDELSSFILSKRFGFISAAFRDLSIPVGCNNKYSEYHKLLKKKAKRLCKALESALLEKDPDNTQFILESSNNLQKLVDAATENVIIFGKEHMKALLTPTLNRRLAFSPPYSPPHSTRAHSSGRARRGRRRGGPAAAPRSWETGSRRPGA